VRSEEYNNLLLVATDDSFIRGWVFNGNQFVPVTTIVTEEATDGEIKVLMARQPQFCLAWDDIHQMLYSGQRDGTINVWSLKQVSRL
jgi:WD40 repeat protein